MSEADNIPAPTAGANDPSAGSNDGHLIPKHRYDEVMARLRSKEEELEYKNQLMQQLSSQKQETPVPDQGFTAEQLGLDEETFRALEKIADHKIGVVAKQYQAQLGHLANNVEASQFLARHGASSEADMKKADQYRRTHYQVTGSWLDLETAHKAAKFEEMSAKKESVVPQNPQNPHTQAPVHNASQDGAQPVPPQPQPSASQQPPAPVPPSVPPAGGSHIQAPSGGNVEPRNFEQMTVEEMEASLDQRGSDYTI